MPICQSFEIAKFWCREYSVVYSFNEVQCKIMGESSKFSKSCILEIQIFKLAGCLQKWIISCLNLLISAFWFLWKVSLKILNSLLHPEFRINPENFHPCIKLYSFSSFLRMTEKCSLKSSQLCTYISITSPRQNQQNNLCIYMLCRNWSGSNFFAKIISGWH